MHPTSAAPSTRPVLELVQISHRNCCLTCAPRFLLCATRRKRKQKWNSLLKTIVQSGQVSYEHIQCLIKHIINSGIMNVITNTSFVITSPRFPLNYPVDVDECWMRTPSCGHHVQLEFTDFNVSLLKYYGNQDLHYPYYRFLVMPIGLQSTLLLMDDQDIWEIASML